MADVFSVAKDLAPFLPLIQPIYNNLLEPKLKRLNDWVKKRDIENEIFDHRLFENKFKEYLCRSAMEYSSMDTLIFPNQQIEIEDLYQPLTIRNTDYNNRISYKIESYPSELFEKYNKIVISDSAGMGKSTLSKFIALKAIKEKKQIPIFIELRNLSSKNSIVNEIFKQINSFENEKSDEFIYQLLSMGEFLIILDGFDEIISDSRQDLVKDLKLFIQKCSNCNFLLTSRPEEAIYTFGDFQLCTIVGLKENEAFELLKKYDYISKSEISKLLIKEIEIVNHQVKEFLTNPFLVSLLYKTYSFKRDIPSRKSTFYNEVFTALYQEHDLSKNAYKRDKHSKLDIQDFRLVLREFAIFTARKSEVGYKKERAIEYLKECKNKLKFLKFKENAFVHDLLTTVPLFIRDGMQIKWSHKSIQDYFAAEYITYHPKKDKIINKLVHQNLRKYQNIIDLVMELDPNLIRHYVLPEILDKLISHFEVSPKMESIDEDQIYFRRMVTFGNQAWINKVKIKDESINSGKDPSAPIQDEFDRVDSYIKKNFDITYHTATQFREDLFVSSTRSDEALFIQMAAKKGLLGKEKLFVNDYKNQFPDLTKSLTYKPSLIDSENPDKEYNKPEFYKDFTHSLLFSLGADFRSNGFFVPDVKYCKVLLENIKDEIREIEEEEFMDEY